MRTLLVSAILFALAFTTPAPAEAGGVVTVCDEAHLLAALAGGGTVTFACSGTITLTSTIGFEVDTSIDGSGQAVTISGNDAVQVFYVDPFTTLTITRLTIANGRAAFGGGGVHNEGALAIHHCTFTENHANSTDGVGSGGAISNEGSLTVSNSTFTGNSAHGAVTGIGGAIFNQGTLTVSDSTFTSNNAQDFGGAIHGSNLAIDRGTFVDNSAVFGGAISGSGLVENSAFTGNSGSEGGAINGSGRLTVNNSTFANNSGDLGGGIGYFGSTIYEGLTVRDSTFSGNVTTGEGGGIFIDGSATVSGSTFNGNSAGVGGGISSHGSGSVTVSNSTFFGNNASFGGGIYKASTGTLTMSNSTLSGNSAGDGGGIYRAGGTVTLKNTIVALSPAGGNCSGAIADGGGNVSYPDASCPGVNADPLLGPLRDNGGPTWTMALGQGSAALDAGIDLTCISAPVNCLDQRGVMRPQGAHCDSGSLERVQEPVLTLVEVCDEMHLRAALAGGGRTVMFTCTGVIPLAAEIEIAANITIDGGGQDVKISGNHAVRVFHVTPGNTLILNGLAVADGSSPSGSGIYSDAGAVIVSHSLFSGHSGGAIVNDGGTLTVNQSTFSANHGRSISNNGDEARLTVHDSLFSGNSGGGIFSYGIGALVIVTNSTFVGNTTTGDGGGIYNEWGGVLTVSDSIFSSNIAGQGGGIHSYGNVIVSNCTFSGNSASNGGGITSFDSLLTVYNSTFIDNDATQGGAIQGNSGGISISNSTFSGNHATDGGAIHNAGGLTVINSTFAGNHATYIGGIHNPEGRATLKNTIVASAPGALNCGGTIVDGGGNLSYPDSTCPGINADPLLGPLQDNGGPTWTMALGDGSAALDAGDDAICAAPPINHLDQRGFPRPWGAHCDIGAVEQALEPAAVSLDRLSAGSMPGAMSPVAIAGLVLAALTGCAVWRRRQTL